MNLSPFAIELIIPYVLGSRSGREIINLFNNYGTRDVYDELGMPDIGKKNGQRASKTEYVRKVATTKAGQISNRIIKL